jgi:hypothetical protein
MKQPVVVILAALSLCGFTSLAAEPTWPELMSQAWQAQRGPAKTEPALQFSAWQATAPFANADFAAVHIPVDKIELQAQRDGKPLWSPETLAQDMVATLEMPAKSSRYFARTITAEKAVKLPMSLGSDDGIELWLNGKKCLSHNASRSAEPDQEAVTLDLVPGDNLLIIKLFNGAGPAGLYFAQKSSAKADLLIQQSWKEFQHQTDWFLQDNDFRKPGTKPGAQDLRGDFQAWLGHTDTSYETGLIQRVLAELGDAGKPLAAELQKLTDARTPAGDIAWLKLYEKAGEARRRQRLAPYQEQLREVVFLKRYNAGHTSFWQVTEDHSGSIAWANGKMTIDNADRPIIACNQTGWDNPGNVRFNCSRYLQNPGGTLCRLRLDNGGFGKIEPLLADKEGAIRDPDISWDGKKLLFSWKKNAETDDYHLYEMELATGKIRQLTDTVGVADIEGVYLPDGDIVFGSTRCIQLVDCWTNPVSNLYRCNPDGKLIRRLCFDQVHDNYPQVLPTGQIIYTRWDYNDRSRLVAHPLFIMNPDGTRQYAYFGGSATLPALIHSRPVPGSDLIVGIVAGHHCPQAGPLALYNRAEGDQTIEALTCLAPVRKETEGLARLWKQQNDGGIPPYGDANPIQLNIDLNAISGGDFAYPWPLSKDAFLVSYTPRGTSEIRPFSLYFLLADGRRELLAKDDQYSCAQPVVVAPRTRPAVLASSVDYRKTEGQFYIQDIYAGESLKGIPRGTIKKLRVVQLHYKANDGGVTEDFRHLPIAPRPNGPWMSKSVLGDAEVCEDGSVAFTAPARTPVYFQALDAKGNAIQTMRSWTMVQPGETYGCVGCHENKRQTPVAAGTNIQALKRGPQPLQPFYGPARPFSYPREIQPILDRHCLKCHDGTGDPRRELPKLANGREYFWPFREKRPVNPLLVNAQTYNAMHRHFWNISYLQLMPYIDPLNCNLHAEPVAPGTFGAVTSPLVKMLEAGHRGVKLAPGDLDKIRCWIDLAAPHYGDYTEGLKPEDLKFYEQALKFRKLYEEEEAKTLKELQPK